MHNCKSTSILATTLHCLVAGIVSGVLGAGALIIIVLLLTLTGAAAAAEDDMPRLRNYSEATQGTLLFRNEQDFSSAPILNTDVVINVTGMIARATVKQKFRNPDDTWKEGVYVFPLPEHAAVDHLLMRVGARVIEGQIKERGEARRAYEAARAAGRKASLIEQERANIFTTSVANIGPREEITIEIQYQHIVPFDSSDFRLRFPMVVAPRYIPGVPVRVEVPEFTGSGWAENTDQVPDAARITPPVLHPDRGFINPVRIHIRLDTGFPLQQIASSYHSIAVKQHNKSSYDITLDGGTTPANRDFELVWQAEADHLPRAALFREEQQDRNYALIMLLPPAQQEAEILPREVIFVIDTSGSMAGASIRQARAALDLALADLRPEDSFNVIQFNSGMDQLFPMPQAVDAESLRTAKKYVAALKARGGTEMAPALHAALDQSGQAGLVSQVIFLTDGSIGNEGALFEIIRGKLGGSRLFTVGIGSAPNSHFMSGAARFGRGTYTYIGRINEVEDKMRALFTKLRAPVLTDLRMHHDASSAVEIWPRHLPDLYAGEPLLITVAAATLPPALHITGRIAGQDWKGDLRLQGGGQETGIATLWARMKIEALLDQPCIQEGDIKKEIIATALEHHLVSRYTSLVAVDITPARVREEILKSMAMPANLPEGWEYEKVFGSLPRTATAAGQHLILGTLLLLLAAFGSLFYYRRQRHAPV